MNLSRSKIFLICCLIFVAGIAMASFLPINFIENDLRWFIGVVVCVVVIILFWPNRKIRIIALVGLFLFLGLWRYAIGLPANTPDKIWHYNGQTVAVVGVVSDEPDIRQGNVKLKVKSRKLKGATPPQPPLFEEEGEYNVSGKILVTTNLYPEYDYGDELEIICDLQAPEKFQGFAYDRYLGRYDIYSVCYYPRLSSACLSAEQNLGGQANLSTCHAKNHGNWFYKNIFKLKDKLRNIINRGLPEPEASLGRAIILGDKKGIPDNLRERFSIAGISHIVAISGMHISILAAMVMAFLLGIGLARKYAFYFAGLFLVSYIMLIGMPASAMRAGLMGFLVLWALYLGRLNKLTNSLVLASAILLMINPKLLRDDIGFQLSFLAVLGIVYVYPRFNQWLEKIKIPKLKGIRDIFNITIAAQVFTLPIIAYNFSIVSLIAPLSNLLILWTLPFLMVAILAGLGLSFLLPGLSIAFFLPAWLLLKYIIKISGLMAAMPFSYFEVGYIWIGWMVIYYAVLGWLIFRKK